MINFIMYNKWDYILKRFIKNIRNKALDKFHKIITLYLKKIKLKRKIIKK